LISTWNPSPYSYLLESLLYLRGTAGPCCDPASELYKPSSYSSIQVDTRFDPGFGCGRETRLEGASPPQNSRHIQSSCPLQLGFVIWLSGTCACRPEYVRGCAPCCDFFFFFLSLAPFTVRDVLNVIFSLAGRKIRARSITFSYTYTRNNCQGHL
jgi:hypothetical protein